MPEFFAAFFFALCLAAAAKDIVALTIPNWLNALMAFLFVPACIVALPGWDIVGWHLLIALVSFFACAFLFFGGAFGGGDAKMIPAVMLWVGPAGAWPFLAGTVLVGGLLCIVMIAMRRLAPSVSGSAFSWESLQTNMGAPYGVAIAAGAFVAAPHSQLLAGFARQFGLPG